MRLFSNDSRVEGHPPGGLRRSGRNALLLLVAGAALLSACSSSGRGTARPVRGESFARPLEIYRELGFITGPGQFPAVASLATMAGPGDSAYVMLAMSLPNSALRFQRDEDGFYAEYRVELTFMDLDSLIMKRFEDREVVRVPSFGETGRTDESIIYQQGVSVPPGSYIVQVLAADVNSSRGFRMSDTLTAPDYNGAAHLGSPVFVYNAVGRIHRDSLPDLITNPRHTVPYGGEAPLVYLESYNSGEQPLDVRVMNDEGVMVWSARATLRDGDDRLRYGVIEIPTETLPLGRFWLEVSGEGTAQVRRPLIMTISEHWMVANFGDVLQFLRYIAHPEELDSLRAGSPVEQRDAWERFWQRRDPLPITDVNEYRDMFFSRVRYATEAFREAGGRAGWNTDRGEVYIVLGPPDHALERFIGNADMRGQPNAEEWVYSAVPGGRLNLMFYDRSGFGRFELTPSSAAAFRSVADRMKPRSPRN